MSPRKSAPAAMAPELVLVDPKTLVLGANVRMDARVDQEFIASIRERGVLEPIVAYRDDAGQLVVLRGQRRTLAATTAKTSLVPVMVVPQPDLGDRVVDQVVENEQRTALAVADRVAAYEQLAAIGLTAEQIAKRTSTPKDTVAAGLAVAASETARATAQVHSLTLDQAAVIAEFEGDDKAVEQLVAAAEEGRGFDHHAQQLRDLKTHAQLIAAAAAELTAAGVTVVDEAKVMGYLKPAKRLGRLPGEPSAEEHAACPGHAAYIRADWEFDNPDGDEDDQAGRHVVKITYVCTDPVGNGHVAATGGNPPAAEKSDAVRAKEAAERRDVIESNKAWDSATKVRRTWLRTFMARKTAPANASAFVAASLAWCDLALRWASEYGNKLAHDLLGLGPAPDYTQRGAAVGKALSTATAQRAQVIGLALVLAAYEDSMVRERWRTVEPATVRYLRYLEEQGYELSEVELRACGAKPRAKAKAKAARRPAGGAS